MSVMLSLVLYKVRICARDFFPVESGLRTFLCRRFVGLGQRCRYLRYVSSRKLREGMYVALRRHLADAFDDCVVKFLGATALGTQASCSLCATVLGLKQRPHDDGAKRVTCGGVPHVGMTGPRLQSSQSSCGVSRRRKLFAFNGCVGNWIVRVLARLTPEALKYCIRHEATVFVARRPGMLWETSYQTF